MNRKTILLTGPTGFLGSHLLKKLDSEDKYTIVAVKRSFSDLKRVRSVKFSNVLFYDIDKIALEDIFNDNKIDLVIHTATEYGRKDGSVHKILEANLLFPIKIIELAISCSTECFINTDSYFNKDHFSYSYLLDYSLSKKSLLPWLKSFSGKLKVVNVVLEHMYGEDDSYGKFVENMIRDIAVTQVDSVDLTYGNQKRDFIYVADVVDAYIKIIDYSLSNKFSFKTVNVGTGVSHEIKYFVEKIKQISNSHTRLNFGAIPYRSDEIMDSKADIQELENLGWRANFTIESGLQRIIKYYGA